MLIFFLPIPFFCGESFNGGGGGGGAPKTEIILPNLHINDLKYCDCSFSDDSFESKACCSDCEKDKSKGNCCGGNDSRPKKNKKKIRCKPFPVPKSCKFSCFDAKDLYDDECEDRCHTISLQLLSSCNQIEFPSDRERFICRMCKFIECTYKNTSCHALRPWIEIIYDGLCGRIDELVIFFAHALYNTDGFNFFTNFCDQQNGRYISRGLLMITGESNYIRLERFSRGWLRNPERLGLLSKSAVTVTIEFWKVYVYRDCQSFCESLKILNPMEVQDGAYENAELCKRLENRIRLYRELCCFMQAKPYVGEC